MPFAVLSVRRALAPKLCGVAFIAMLGSCGGDATSGPGIMLTLALDGNATRPNYLKLTWAGDDGVIARDKRVPETGALPMTGDPLGTVFVRVGAAGGGARIVVATGFDGADHAICEGTVDVTLAGAAIVAATLNLHAGVLVDSDGDGLPDALEPCGRQYAGFCVVDGATLDAPGDVVLADAGTSDSAGSLDVGVNAARVAKGAVCTRDEDCASSHCGQARAGRFCSAAGMAAVPGGPFTRGCDPSSDSACQSDERPAETLQISGFEIDTTEVTQAAYNACVSVGRCTAPASAWDPQKRALLPVTYTTWAMASAYCAWAGKRLPTEAEWEKAARGAGSVTRYPWGNDAPDCGKAQFAGCGLADVVPVGSLSGDSPFGAADMAGNAAEWVNDWYAAGYYAGAPAMNPPGPGSGSTNVRRGGGFSSSADDVRVSARVGTDNGVSPETVGFRCARGF